MKKLMYSYCLALIVSLFVLVLFKYYYEDKFDILFLTFNTFFTVIIIGIFIVCTPILLMRKKSLFILINALVISGLVLYAFNITFLTTVERSLTINIMSLLANSNGGIKADQLETEVNNFMKDTGGFTTRMKEQLHLQTIVIENDTVKLTDKGHSIYEINKWIGEYFNVKGGNFVDSLDSKK